MRVQSIQRLDSGVATTIKDAQDARAREFGEDPKTLLGLLQRAARLFPSNGIAFKDQGWDQKSVFMSYADLLSEAMVTFPMSETRIKSANEE
jgi:predicted signal transduction protein with EAL and GGDEF domain